MKVINEADLVTYASSPGIRLDPTPPVPLRIVAVDPEYDMTLTATHQGHLDSLAAWWDFEETESEIVKFKVRKSYKFKNITFPIYASTCLPTYLPISVYLSIYLSIHPSNYLSIHMSV